jgi:hypothetical protein
MFYKLNIKIDVGAAQQYYSVLEKDYQHMKWESALGATSIYGWSLHVLHGVTGSFGFYNMNTEPLGVDNYYRSKLCFGWAEEILNLFPYGYRAGVGVSPAGTVVPPHIDENWPDMMRLHIPIHTNENYVWHTHEPDLHMELGSVYLVDTSHVHATTNSGSTPRVHLGMNIPRDNFNDIKQLFI